MDYACYIECYAFHCHPWNQGILLKIMLGWRYYTPNVLGDNDIIIDSLMQGWRSGKSACLPPMCPGFDSRTRRHMWAEFVDSLLCPERFFSGNSGFPLSTNTNI